MTDTPRVAKPTRASTRHRSNTPDGDDADTTEEELVAPPAPPRPQTPSKIKSVGRLEYPNAFDWAFFVLAWLVPVVYVYEQATKGFSALATVKHSLMAFTSIVVLDWLSKIVIPLSDSEKRKRDSNRVFANLHKYESYVQMVLVYGWLGSRNVFFFVGAVICKLSSFYIYLHLDELARSMFDNLIILGSVAWGPLYIILGYFRSLEFGFNVDKRWLVVTGTLTLTLAVVLGGFYIQSVYYGLSVVDGWGWKALRWNTVDL